MYPTSSVQAEDTTCNALGNLLCKIVINDDSRFISRLVSPKALRKLVEEHTKSHAAIHVSCQPFLCERKRKRKSEDKTKQTKSGTPLMQIGVML